MTLGPLIAFAIWLALAMAGGIVIVAVWQRLRARCCGGDDGASLQSDSVSRKDGQLASGRGGSEQTLN